MRRAGAALLGLLALAPAGARAQEGATSAPVSRADPSARDTVTLGAAVEHALGRASDVVSARAAVNAASSSRWADWGAFLPTATGSLNFSRTRFTTNTFLQPEGTSGRLDQPLQSTTRSPSQSLSFRWDLLRGGRRFAGLEQGAAQEEAASERLSSAERQTRQAIRQAYYDALEQRGLVGVAEDQLTARRRDLEMTRKRYEIAAADRSPLLAAQIAEGQAELDLADARAQAGQSRRALAVAMGVEEGTLGANVALTDVGALPDASGLDSAALAERAVRTNPELAALRADASAASASLWSARASYLPTISLGYTLGRSEQLGPNGSFFVLDPSNRSQFLNLTVSWQLFTGFDRKRQAAQAGMERDQARARRTKRELEIGKQVRDLVADLRRRQHRLRVLERTAGLSRKRLDLVREQYRLGTTDYLHLQDTIDRLSQLERQRITERYEYLKAWAELEAAAGDLP